MPASIDILPSENSAPTRAARKPQAPSSSEALAAFPDAMKDVESEAAAGKVPVSPDKAVASPDKAVASPDQVAASPDQVPASADKLPASPGTAAQQTSQSDISAPVISVASSQEQSAGTPATDAAGEVVTPSDAVAAATESGLPVAPVPVRETYTAPTALLTDLPVKNTEGKLNSATPTVATPAAPDAARIIPALTGSGDSATGPQIGNALKQPAALFAAQQQSGNALIQPAASGAVQQQSGNALIQPAALSTAQSQVAATSAQPQQDVGKQRPTVLPASRIEELPTLQLSRIDLAGRKKTSVAATGTGQSTSQGIQPTTGQSGMISASTSSAVSGLAAASPAAGQNADLATPIRLSLNQGAHQASLQPMSEGQSAPIQTAIESPLASNVATSASGTTPTTIQAAQNLSFSQQMAQSAAQPPAQQLGVSIARGVREGLDRIEIQLHPAELGRVDVRMELGHDGRITAVVSAERSDTLEQLRRDIDQLERALADSGFETDGKSFRFEDGNSDTAGNGDDGTEDGAGEEAGMPAQLASTARALHFDGLSVDISV